MASRFKVTDREIEELKIFSFYIQESLIEQIIHNSDFDNPRGGDKVEYYELLSNYYFLLKGKTIQSKLLRIMYEKL